MAQFQLSPCVLSDIDGMTDVYFKAFNNTYMDQMLFPRQPYAPDAVRSWLSARFEKLIIQGHPEMKLFKVTEVATRRVVAVARFGYPFKLTDEEQAKRDAEKAEAEKERDEAEKATGKSVKFPEGANVEACGWYFGAMDVMREKYMNWDQDYICYLLITDPDFQRRGLGGMLLGHVTALADAESRRIYLEASAVGHPLYEKLGFRDIDLITIDLKKWGGDHMDYNWVMMREPQARANA